MPTARPDTTTAPHSASRRRDARRERAARDGRRARADDRRPRRGARSASGSPRPVDRGRRRIEVTQPRRVVGVEWRQRPQAALARPRRADRAGSAAVARRSARRASSGDRRPAVDARGVGSSDRGGASAAASQRGAAAPKSRDAAPPKSTLADAIDRRRARSRRRARPCRRRAHRTQAAARSAATRLDRAARCAPSTSCLGHRRRCPRGPRSSARRAASRCTTERS